MTTAYELCVPCPHCNDNGLRLAAKGPFETDITITCVECHGFEQEVSPKVLCSLLSAITQALEETGEIDPEALADLIEERTGI